MTEEERHEGSVSRRTMLKRIGIAGAVVWATPVVTSLNTPAFAASAPTRPCDSPGTCAGGGFPVCGSDEFGSCFCFVNGAGGGFCGSNEACGFLQACANGSCPSGFACAIDTCCGTPVCIAICGANGEGRQSAPIAGQQTVLRPAGRS